MEQLDYNILFRWFVGMDMDEPVWVPTVFTKNRDRLLTQAIARSFFRRVVERAQAFMSDEHFTVDGTLIEAWASQRSFQPKDGPPAGDGRNFHGQSRKNDTHASATDPDAKLYRKSNNAEPNLAFHAERLTDRHPHPLVGLVQHGPYSRSLPHLVLDPIRIAVIAPHGMLRSAEALIGELETRYAPRERNQYLVDFLGFSRVFGVRAVLADPSVRLELPTQLDDDFVRSPRGHQLLAERLTQALSALQARRCNCSEPSIGKRSVFDDRVPSSARELTTLRRLAAGRSKFVVVDSRGDMSTSTPRKTRAGRPPRGSTDPADTLPLIICAGCGEPIVPGQKIAPLFSAQLVKWSQHPVLSKPVTIRGIIATNGSAGRSDLSIGEQLRQRAAMGGAKERAGIAAFEVLLATTIADALVAELREEAEAHGIDHGKGLLFARGGRRAGGS